MAGNFHFAPGKSFQSHSVHGRWKKEGGREGGREGGVYW